MLVLKLGMLKKSEITQRFQRAKEREKALKAQISTQRERIRLEMQERENMCLESELAQHEYERTVQDREQQRLDNLTSEKRRLEEAAKCHEHEFELAQERLKAEFKDRQLQLEHQIKLRELELDQQMQESELQKKFDSVQTKHNVVGGHVPQTQTVGRSNIGLWLEGVWGGDDWGTSSVHNGAWASHPVGVSTQLSQNLANSGANLLTEICIDHNTTQFIAAQAIKACKNVSRAHSLPREISMNSLLQVTQLGVKMVHLVVRLFRRGIRVTSWGCQ